MSSLPAKIVSQFTPRVILLGSRNYILGFFFPAQAILHPVITIPGRTLTPAFSSTSGLELRELAIRSGVITDRVSSDTGVTKISPGQQPRQEAGNVTSGRVQLGHHYKGPFVTQTCQKLPRHLEPPESSAHYLANAKQWLQVKWFQREKKKGSSRPFDTATSVPSSLPSRIYLT